MRSVRESAFLLDAASSPWPKGAAQDLGENPFVKVEGEGNGIHVTTDTLGTGADPKEVQKQVDHFTDSLYNLKR